MEYTIWTGLVVALVMVCTTPNPLWWMIAALGIGANGVVIAANGWKMPVRRASLEETVRHKPMTISTRYKWLADIIPTGFGLASVGDFFVCAGLLGAFATRSSFAYTQLMALLCFVWWGSGWIKGFRLFEKWPREVIRDSRKNIPIVLLLILLGNLFHVRGCGSGDLRASVKNIETAVTARDKVIFNSKPESKWRSLGVLADPSPVFLRRLRETTAKQEQERDKEAVIRAVVFFSMTNSNVNIIPKRARSGPFCRVTCSAHHGGEYDVETVPELCRANWIPPTAVGVPGWYPVSDTEETTNPWPGPAQTGFEKYKLYWSSLQSDAKIVHASSQEVH